MNEPSDKRAALLRVSRSVGLIGSLALHGLMVALVAWAPPLPEVDFQLELPSEVEFGVPEAAEMVEPPAPTEVAPPPPAPATPAEPATPEEAPKPKPKPKGPDAGRPEPDAGTTDAAAEDDKPDAGRPVPQTEPPKPEVEPKPATTPALGAFAPKGSQINIRLDVAQIRSSPLSEDARLLLADSPDFRAVIDGSGIDAVRDLDRLYLASPDLRRANVVIAGQHTAQPELPQRAVASLANIAGKTAPWRVKNGVRTAPWRNRDETERVVALLTSEQFVISPAKDLGRVLAIARAFTEQDKAKSKLDDAGKTALLALPEGVAAVLTVYDARRFARGNLRGVPTHLEVVGKILPDGGVSVAIRGELENDDAADDAVEYWTKLRDRFASHPLVALIGMRAPLIAASIKREDNELRVEGTLTQQQARTLLGFARSTIAPPPVPPMPDKPPPPPPLPPLRQKSAPPPKPPPR